jgi:hypothetical protein
LDLEGGLLLELPRDPALPDATEPGAEAAAEVKGETDDALEATDDGDVLAAEAADVLEPETAALGATQRTMLMFWRRQLQTLQKPLNDLQTCIHMPQHT